MSTTPPASQTVDAYLEQLAAKVPAPGGGAAAAITLAQAAALAGMVIQYTLGKSKFAQHEAANHARLADATRIRTAALSLAHEDAVAYDILNAMQRSGSASASELAVATANAIKVPHDVMTLSALLLGALTEYPGATTTMLASDVRVAAILARAALQAARANVEVNLASLPEPERASIRERLGLESLERTGEAAARAVESIC